jgi:hypothetical protein
VRRAGGRVQAERGCLAAYRNADRKAFPPSADLGYHPARLARDADAGAQNDMLGVSRVSSESAMPWSSKARGGFNAKVGWYADMRSIQRLAIVYRHAVT